MSKDGNRNPDSPQPALPPPVNSARAGGEQYEGIQNEQQWSASEVDQRGIVDASRKAGLYRLTLVGSNVECTIRYGTNATLLLTKMRPPLSLTLPGNVGVSARPLGTGGAAIAATLVRVTASSTPNARRYRSAPGPINPEVVSFFTLAISAFTIDGNVLAGVPALTRVPLIQPATLTGGSGLEEFNP